MPEANRLVTRHSGLWSLAADTFVRHAISRHPNGVLGMAQARCSDTSISVSEIRGRSSFLNAFSGAVSTQLCFSVCA